MQELKPCPFCGNHMTPLYNKEDGRLIGWEHPDIYEVENCPLSAVDRDDNELYIPLYEKDNWNRRVSGASEVRCGEWIAIKGFLQYSNCYYTKHYRCSICNEISRDLKKYCPECGAKMYKEGEHK